MSTCSHWMQTSETLLYTRQFSHYLVIQPHFCILGFFRLIVPFPCLIPAGLGMRLVSCACNVALVGCKVSLVG